MSEGWFLACSKQTHFVKIALLFAKCGFNIASGLIAVYELTKLLQRFISLFNQCKVLNTHEIENNAT